MGALLAQTITPSVINQLHSSGAPRAGSATTAKLRKAAGEFESILLESLWKSMRETFKNPDDPDSDPTMDNFDDLGIQTMSSAVGKSGGLGIKNLILKYLGPDASDAANAVHGM